MSIMFLLSVLPVSSVLSVMSTLSVLSDRSVAFLSRGSALGIALGLRNLSGLRGFPIHPSIRQCIVTRPFSVLFGWSNVLTPIVNDNDTLFMNRSNPPPTFANQRLR